MKETKGSIAVKIGMIIAFIIFIVGGGGLTLDSLDSENYIMLGIGMFILLLGIFTCAVLAQWVAHYDAKNGHHGSDRAFVNLNFKNSLKGGALFAFIISFMFAFALGLYFWIKYGYWYLGVLGIISFILMLIIAITISINYQTAAAKKVLNDSNAIETTGVIASKSAGLSIFFLNKAIIFFWKYNVNVGSDIHSITYLKSTNKLSKQLSVGDGVKVKLNPNETKYCAIIDILK